MRYLLIFILLSLFAFKSSAQYFLGYNQKETLIYAEKIGGIKIDVKHTSAGNLNIQWEMPATRCSYLAVFSGDDVVVNLLIFPYNTESRDQWAKVFDEKYVRNSDNRGWKSYANGEAVNISIEWDDQYKRNYYMIAKAN